MTHTELQNLIEQSLFLVPEEKAYWLRNLPKMTPDQCAQLSGILTENDRSFSTALSHLLAPLVPALESAFAQLPS